jgi:translation elongation factor EF-1beta
MLSKKLFLDSLVYNRRPWDDTTDLAELEKLVRAIEMEGLEWKACMNNYLNTIY